MTELDLQHKEITTQIREAVGFGLGLSSAPINGSIIFIWGQVNGSIIIYLLWATKKRITH